MNITVKGQQWKQIGIIPTPTEEVDDSTDIWGWYLRESNLGGRIY